MRNFLKISLMGMTAALVSFASMATAQATPSFKPALVDQKPANIFTPQGFDDNDNVQVVLYGFLPSTCHKTGPVQYRIDEATQTIRVRSSAYFYSGCFCAQVEIPYTQVIDLGVLTHGHYAVVYEGSDGSVQKMAELPIAVARVPQPDDYLYAPVDHLHFNPAANGEGPSVTLSGTFDSSCMGMTDMKVTYRPNQVIEIQPIADYTNPTPECTNEPSPFSVTVKLRPDLHGRALIHVRALNGQSVNQVVEL